MIRLLTSLVVCALAAPAFAKAPTTDQEKTLYALGLSISKSLAVFALSPEELAMVQQGLADGVKGTKPAVEIETWGPKIQELAQARQAVAAEKDKAKGADFLEAAAKEPGAKKTPSGLVFKSITEGKGDMPTKEQTVKVHYKGTLIDGTEFDSSYSRGQPAEFPLGRVVPCWTEGVGMMKPGGKARLVCPPDLAYGDRGAPPKIGPGATLVFEVELLEVK